MRQLDWLDSTFISLETPTSPQQIGMLGIYDASKSGPDALSYQAMYAYLEGRISDLPIFRTRVAQVPGRLDRPYWVMDEHFDLGVHIRQLVLPSPGNWRQLCDEIARLHAMPLDMSRPLWEIHVIQGLDEADRYPAPCFALYVKLHHAMVDGDLGQGIMAILHEDPGGRQAPPSQKITDTQGRQGGSAEMVGRAMVNRVRGLAPMTRDVADVTWDLGDTLWRVYKDELPPPQMGPRTRFDDPLGSDRVFEGISFDLAEVRNLSAVTQVSINDVMVSVIGGGLRRYLISHDDLPRDSLIAKLPVSIPSSKRSKSGSRPVGVVSARLGTQIEDPIDRLHAVNQFIQDARKLLHTPLVDPLRILGMLPPFLAKPAARVYSHQHLGRLLPASTGIVISNITGPEQDLYCCGARLLDMYWPGVLSPGVSLFHSIFSTGGHLTLGFTSDRTILPDPEHYRSCLLSAYAELMAAVLPST